MGPAMDTRGTKGSSYHDEREKLDATEKESDIFGSGS